MSIKDILGFEKFNLKEILGGFKDNPLQSALFGMDRFGRGVGEKLLGKDDSMRGVVNNLGAPREQTYAGAEAKGIDTDSGRNMHTLAQIIAGTIAGGYGAGKLGGAMEGIPGMDKVGQYTGQGGDQGGFMGGLSKVGSILSKAPQEQPTKPLPSSLDLLPHGANPAAASRLRQIMKNLETTGNLYG